MAKVLVFESDSEFASDVRTYLEQGGCQVTVVDDGTAGLQEASTNRPDLILLTIELPRMNGFSVCNKLRRSADLKDIPLIIMSSDSSEEVFEQHRRLRTRADEYLHKPAQASALKTYIEKYVALSANGESAAGLITDEEFELNADEFDSAIELDETELVADEAHAEQSGADMPVDSASRVIDEEVEAFTENAFDALLNEGAASAGGAMPPVAVEEAIEQETMSAAEAVALSKSAQSMPSDSRLMARPVSGAPRDSVIAGRLQQLEDELVVAREQNEKLLKENHRLAAEMDDVVARAKQATGSAGSAREILDLRERLNQKERELLDLRDQQMQKDKELLQARDANLAAERANADLSEKQLELDKQLTALDRALKSAKADKELAAKRGEDFRRKAERVAEDLQSERDAAVALQAAHDNALAELRREHEAALGRARQETADARSHGEAELQAARQAHEAELGQKQAEAEERLANRERELRQESDEVLGKAYRSHGEALNAAKLEFDARLNQFQQQMSALEAEKHEVERVLGETQASLSAEQDKSARALGKWHEDQGNIERAKNALAAVLAQIEELEARPL